MARGDKRDGAAGRRAIKRAASVLLAVAIAAASGLAAELAGLPQPGVSQPCDPATPFSAESADTVERDAPPATTDSDENALTPEAGDDRLVVRFLDVGQGDATIVEFPDGKTLVVDAGMAEKGAQVAEAVAADGREGVDWLVATHPDSDHIGGMPALIKTCDVASVWAPRVASGTKTYERFLKAVKAKGLSIDAVETGKCIAEGDGYSIDLLWPPAGADFADDNAYSAVIRVTFGSTTVLLTGDAPVEALERANPGHADILKVSHHGSASGTDTRLAHEISCGIAVVSYGTDNEYGHPAKTVLDALRGAGAQIYGTGANGTVTVTSDGMRVSVSCEREGSVVAQSDDAGASSAKLE